MFGTVIMQQNTLSFTWEPYNGIPNVTVYAFMCKRFRTTRHTRTLGIPL
jgi:hypothetical protein